MRPEHRAEQVIAVVYVRHPVAHRLVDGILQRARAGVHAPDRRPEQLHPEDVQRLPLHVVGAHVDVAGQTEQRTRGGARHAVLPRPGLGDDTALAHPAGQQRLANGVVDLVRAGMGEILPLEEDARAP
jgi:hypothetical protein